MNYQILISVIAKTALTESDKNTIAQKMKDACVANIGDFLVLEWEGLKLLPSNIEYVSDAVKVSVLEVTEE